MRDRRYPPETRLGLNFNTVSSKNRKGRGSAAAPLHSLPASDVQMIARTARGFPGGQYKHRIPVDGAP